MPNIHARRQEELSAMRCFAPEIVSRYIVENPYQPSASPTSSLGAESPARRSVDTSSTAGDGVEPCNTAAYSPPSAYFTSIVPKPSSKSRLTKRSDSRISSSLALSLSKTASPECRTSATQLGFHNEPTGTPHSHSVGEVDAIRNDDDALVLLLHQEAIYRQLVYPDVDTWFTSLVETAWAERDRILLSATEQVQRYWVSSDEVKARETLEVFRRNAETARVRRAWASQLAVDELVSRSAILQEQQRKAAELESLLLADYQACACATSVARRTASHDPPTEAEVAALSVLEGIRTVAKSNDADTSSTPAAHHRPLRPKPPPLSVAPSARNATADASLHHFIFGGSEVITFAVDAESSARAILENAESAQRAAWCAQLRNYVERTATLRRSNASKALTLEEAEMTERRVQASEYFSMLLRAVEVQETLSRREIALSTNDAERKRLESMEREEWIYARRAECARRVLKEQAQAEALKEDRLALVERERHLARQRTVFERSECDARFEIFRKETRSFQHLTDESMESWLYASAFQQRFEVRLKTIVWTPATYGAVVVAESAQRHAIIQEEAALSKALEAAEVAAFLHSHRNMMINRDVKEQLAVFDAKLSV